MWTKLFGVMMALMCLAMVGGVSATTSNNVPVQWKEIKITMKINPSTGYHWEPEYNKSCVKLVSRQIVPINPDITGGPAMETFVFKGEIGQRIILNEFAPGINVPITTELRYIK